MEYRIKREKPDNELFHSSTYQGDEVSDDLYHYKYIDKYKSKSGKWIYVYKKIKKNVEDALGFKAKERMNNAYNRSEMYDGRSYDYEREAANAKDTKTAKKYTELANRSKEAAERYSDISIRNYDIYDRSLAGAIDRGREAVNNLLRKKLDIR